MSLAISNPPAATVSRRTRATRAPSRQAEARRQKLSFYLSGEAVKRLGIAGVMEQSSQSAIVERLVLENLRRWVVADRARAADPATVEVSAD